MHINFMGAAEIANFKAQTLGTCNHTQPSVFGAYNSKQVEVITINDIDSEEQANVAVDAYMTYLKGA